MITKNTGKEIAKVLICQARARDKLIKQIGKAKDAAKRAKLEEELAALEASYKHLLNYEVR